MDFFKAPHLHRHINGFNSQERSSQKALQTLHAGLGFGPVGPRGGNWLGQNHAKSDNKSRESEHPMEGNYYRNAEHIWNIPLECGHIFTFHAGKSSIRSAHLGYEYLEILGVRRMPNQDKPRS